MSHECFADEIAIDFPSVGSVVDRMRDRFLGERDDADVYQAEVAVTRFEAAHGSLIAVQVPVRATCARCGGRGETWTERCVDCRGTGESLQHHAVRIPVPRGVADGARIRFRLNTPDRAAVRVEVRVAVRPAAV